MDNMNLAEETMEMATESKGIGAIGVVLIGAASVLLWEGTKRIGKFVIGKAKSKKTKLIEVKKEETGDEQEFTEVNPE